MGWALAAGQLACKKLGEDFTSAAAEDTLPAIKSNSRMQNEFGFCEHQYLGVEIHTTACHYFKDFFINEGPGPNIIFRSAVCNTARRRFT